MYFTCIMCVYMCVQDICSVVTEHCNDTHTPQCTCKNMTSVHIQNMYMDKSKKIYVDTQCGCM